MKREEIEAKILAHELESLAFKKEGAEEYKESKFYFSLAFKIRMHLIEKEAEDHETD